MVVVVVGTRQLTRQSRVEALVVGTWQRSAVQQGGAVRSWVRGSSVSAGEEVEETVGPTEALAVTDTVAAVVAVGGRAEQSVQQQPEPVVGAVTDT